MCTETELRPTREIPENSLRCRGALSARLANQVLKAPCEFLGGSQVADPQADGLLLREVSARDPGGV
jgi:hypothetical protein